MIKTAKWLVGIASLAHLVAYCFAVPEHIVDSTWPFHARFHVFQALVWIVGLDLVCAILAFGPFARGVAWARWALLTGLIFGQGAYFMAMIAIPDGHPPEGLAAHLPLLGILLVYSVGLVFGWRQDSVPPQLDPEPAVQPKQ